jgi:hypothetical protein
MDRFFKFMPSPELARFAMQTSSTLPLKTPRYTLCEGSPEYGKVMLYTSSQFVSRCYPDFMMV